MADNSQHQPSRRASNAKTDPPRRPSQASSIPPQPTPTIQGSVEANLTPAQVNPPSIQNILPPPATPIAKGQNAPKVAIPRLHNKDPEGSAVGSAKGGRHRVGHACEQCRTRKTKCSGERPVCKHCQDFKLVCSYADGKRDRVKKQFGTMTEKVQDYESLLRELKARVGEQDADLIQRALDKDVFNEFDSPSFMESTYSPYDSGGESQVSATIGSTGAVDKIEEDFNRNEPTRATGFIGKNSEITWMQRLKQEVAIGSPPEENEEQDRAERDFERRSGGARPMFETRKSGSTPLQDFDEGFSASATSYHLDDFVISIPDMVDQYEIPPRELADNLFRTYLHSVHSSFPIIGKATFTAQYRKFFSGPHMKPGNKWLAILNLILAISARHAHLVQANWRGDERDHLIYFTRARMLAMNSDSIFNHPDLQQIQMEGLLAFYLLSTHQINRAWTFAGMAIRASIGLGINMRNESTNTPDTSKEIRYRVWWALYVLEHLLCIMTGRPTSVQDKLCTAPLPAPLEEENFQTENAAHILGSEMQKTTRLPSISSRSNKSSTPSSGPSRHTSKPSASPATPGPKFEWVKNIAPSQSLYFLDHVELMRITHEILNKLYTPHQEGEVWSDIQSDIETLDTKILNWRSSLPIIFDFGKSQTDQQFLRQRMSLGLAFYGTRITINRPCLCRLDRKIPHQSEHSNEFNRNAAAKCVQMAREMLDLIPDVPNAVGLYRVSPWWCVLHYLMQAASVLMLELSFRAHHMPEEAENILQSAKKAVRWLYQMAEENMAARRAWSMCDALIREVAPKIGHNVDDLPMIPPGIDQSFNTIDFGGPIMPMGNLQPPVYPSTSQHEQPPIFQRTVNDPLIYTSYDEYFPWASRSEETQGSMFLSAGEMDPGQMELENEQEEPGERWN